MWFLDHAVTTKHKLGGGDGDVSVGVRAMLQCVKVCTLLSFHFKPSVVVPQDLFGAAAVSAVGSVDPISNFNAMIARRDIDLMDKAIAGMQTQIDRCVVRARKDFNSGCDAT
jgi:hypothetical protein